MEVLVYQQEWGSDNKFEVLNMEKSVFSPARHSDQLAGPL